MVEDNPELLLAVENHEGVARTCRICYEGEDQADAELLSPCKCSGTIKWVHRQCLAQWFQNAPYEQVERCNACTYAYQKRFRLKPIREWAWPNLRLRFLDFCEIALDIWSTVDLVRGIVKTFQGCRSVVLSMLHLAVWKGFIANGRRIMYYRGLGCSIVSSVAEPIVLNAE